MKIQFYIITVFLALFTAFSLFNVNIVMQRQTINLLIINKNLPPVLLLLCAAVVSWFVLILGSSIGQFSASRHAARRIRDMETEILEKDKTITQLKATAFDKGFPQIKEFREFVVNNIEEINRRVSCLEQSNSLDVSGGARQCIHTSV
ncbi:MAG: hypothetical protein AB1546_04610 [bacterium]